MKQLFFLLLTLLTINAHAQNFEVGFNGGTVYNPSLSNNAAIYGANKVTLSTYGISVIKNWKKWQYGLSFDYSSNNYKDKLLNSPGIIDYGAYVTIPVYPIIFYDWFNIQAQHETFKFIANRIMSVKNFEMYLGAFVGDVQSKYTARESESYEIVDKENLLTAGMQAGCTCYVTKHIGINAQAAGAYNFDIHDAVKGQVSYPLTFGIRYRLQ